MQLQIFIAIYNSKQKQEIWSRGVARISYERVKAGERSAPALADQNWAGGAAHSAAESFACIYDILIDFDTYYC